MQPQLKIAHKAVKAHRVHNLGVDGRGSRVGVIDVGGKFKQNNPLLQQGLTQSGQFTSLSEHTTAVVGCVRSAATIHQCVAPRARVWVGGSSSGSSNQLQNRANAAVTWGARVLNLSFGGDSDRMPDGGARFFDDLAFTERVTVVASAGNSGNENGNVLSPGLGFNVLAVGNYNDRNTAAWSDDQMAPSSSYRDPLSFRNDREKPDVCAPGTGLASTTHARLAGST